MSITLFHPIAFSACFSIGLLFASFNSSATAEDQSGQWFQWRGPNRDGISQEKGLMAEYDTYLLTINPNTGNPLGEEQRLDDRIRHLCANI